MRKENMNNFTDRMIKCLEEIGVYVDECDIIKIDLFDLIADSIQFMLLIVNIEEEFEIEIPPKLLIVDNFRSLENIKILIEELKN